MRSMILLLVAAAFLPSCTPADPSPTPANVSPEEFQQIQWILGKWRGTLAGREPFFETYRMIDDSTIAQDTWSDSTFTSRTDPSIISLRKGQVANGAVVATEWNAASVRFEPSVPNASSYTWRMENADRWTASFPVSDTHERVYIMTRVPE